MILSADTNLFLYAANPASPHYEASKAFFSSFDARRTRFILCGLVLVEIYMQLRNPDVLKKPRTAKEAAAFCQILRSNPSWEHTDYEPDVAPLLWKWAAETTTGFRQIIDARLALTLRYHGVTHFATANEKHFAGFEFENVWNPLSA